MNSMRIIDGIPVNPELPDGFWETAHDERPAPELEAFWEKPFVLTMPHPEWEGGFRFDTYCLTDGAWDRPTAWGKFGTLEEAVRCAHDGPSWRS